MEPIELKATTRQVLGKKVRFLRRGGAIPAHIFGHNVASAAVQCDAAQLQQVLPQAGKTGLISLRLDEAEPRNVMVREIQKDPMTGSVLHVDFYEVAMAEECKVEVPIVLAGQAPGLKTKETILVQDLHDLAIGCLPVEIPSSIEVDVGSLTDEHREIRVKNIRLNEKITVLSDPDAVIARLGILRAEKVEEVVAVPTAEAEAAAAEAAAAAPEGEKPEEKKEEE